ncbi:MAG: OmpH family outer membrane protein [Magnetovibrio sp.]|nr:OmpH family outer membrane protein [Magnetovibrio sp.]
MSLKSILWMSVAVFGVLMMAPGAQAQNANGQVKPANIGVFMAVLDTDGIYIKAKAMKSIHEQLAQFQSELQANVDKEKQSLQKADEELNRKRTLLAPELFAEERKQLQGRVVAFQRKIQAGNQKLNQARAEANTKVSKVLGAVIKDIVKTNGITIVFNKKMTVISDPSMDISKLVLNALDKRLPSVQITNPIQ